VAERAFSVKADELLRKPFQPQDLISRVRHLLNPAAKEPPNPAAAASAAAALSAIFSPAPPAAPLASDSTAIGATAELFPVPLMPVPAAPPRPSNGDLTKMRVEVLRLEGLVKKLQAELLAERDYARALEEHIKTLQQV
jgi:CheY-like chemotaxis protein